MSRTLQRGFSAVEGVIVVLVVAAIGVSGYFVYDKMQKTDEAKSPSASEQTDAASTPAAPAVEDTDDLDAAAKTLDETNLEASTTDSAELDQELGAF